MQSSNNIWIEKNNIFEKFNAEYTLDQDPDTNSIRFKINAHGFSYGYVIGHFNHWKKEDRYKLVWEADPDDGSLWLTKNVLKISSLINGSNQYSFVLVDLEGNERRLSASNRTFEPLTFNWCVNPQILSIKASEDYIVPGYKVDLVAITESLTKKRSIVDVTWRVEPKSKLIEIKNNQLIIDPAITDISEVKVFCSSKNNPNHRAERVFRIAREPREGQLVHFVKKDDQYLGQDFSWELWTYDEKGKTRPKSLSKKSDFGLYADCVNKNIIARKRTWNMYWQNDWAEQTGSFKTNEEHDNFYIVYGDYDIYTSLNDVINRTNARINYAVLDEPNKIEAYLSDTPLVGTIFELWINSKKVTHAVSIIKYKSKKVIFTNLPTDLNPSDLIEIRANNTFMPTKVCIGNFLDKYYYPNNDMGVTFSNDIVSFRIWAPTAKHVELLIYHEDDNDKHEMPDDAFNLIPEPEYGTHSVSIAREFCENKFYLYRFYFDDIDYRGNKYTKITYAIDPYAIGLGANGRKGFILDLNSEDLAPESWRNSYFHTPNNPQDAIIYELHVRDFTISPDSNIPDNIRGKFLGTVYEGSEITSPDGELSVSTGIDSLHELGVTHVHLLPIFDFSSVDESNANIKNNRNWGYDPQNYNAPDGSYSINPFDPTQRIKGAREMIAGFHNKGIGVIMDMVYNHMTDTSNFDSIVPKYYFRTDSLGHFTNGSGCGNELDTEKPMVRKFIKDSVLHWVKNYKVNGLRFDLMELIDLDTIKEITEEVKQIDPGIIVYGEPWKAGDSPLRNGTFRGTQRNQDFSVFNDAFRDAIRGNNSPGNGYVNGDAHNPANIGKVMEGLKGSIHDLTANPKETINYVDAHDNYTLWDQIEKSLNRNIQAGNYRQNIQENIFDSRRVRQNSLALGIVLTSQGVPFLHGGCEFLRTKQGDHNSYKSNDDINAFHWQDKLQYKPFFDYVKGLIKIRKEHPAFRMTSPEDISKHLIVSAAYHDLHSGVIVSHLKDNANGDMWKNIVVVYNATAIENYDINDIVPITETNEWHVVANHERAGTETIEKTTKGKLPPLRAYSMLIIHS
ncbi:type I pullulanase [Francisella philomiragia]|uniref:type I pullulanase n=1 Tax=Francisella philomiragia TaxID=28110 RepID=UPI0035174976